ncbi:Gfo/Idh/MocA family protein [Candidatus Caldatribacterium sp.]|uniref:Gfo/Idh/MocA family protein n=1 Tax=Candidatus Caldatribacterium sp. TaxID=2282143 RepID=UPI0029950A10|nr:Gfo/Idh/MocA family oxidoreductase [Candidatus Caldatribacterium sp.]MDW8080578.1 Gfo/Idh/MocA family oxidoreductase [Candidatus Calescibacterium sp.]
MKKVAILGSGFIASIHMEAWKTIEGAEVCAFFEVHPDRASDFQKKYNLPHYDSFRTLLERENVDVVDICLPTFLHREYTEMAANAGKHVFCEKPIALTLEDALAMREVCARNGVFLMIGHVLRFWGEYVEAKKLLDAGVCGRVRFVEAFRLSVTPVWSVGGWILDPRLSGGASLDLHIHDIDYVNWLLGEPAKVFAQGVRSERGSFDHITTQVEYRSGALAVIQGGWMMQGDFPFTCGFRILGDSGVLEWTFRAGVNIEERGKSSPMVLYEKGGSRREIQVPGGDPYGAELRYFLNCVERKSPPELGTADQAILALRVALAAQRSASGGNSVVL